MSQISVIVPVYKVEPYLNRCVDSILGQTFGNFELILVDDGSPDNCGKICDEYAEKDDRIVVIHQENGGLSAARNAGLDWIFENSDSEWIAFVDSDDWIHPLYLKLLIDSAKSFNTNLSSCMFQKTMGEICDIGDDTFSAVSPEDFWVKDQVNATVSWGKLYRKDLFKEIRFPTGKIHEDEYTTYKLLFACDKIAFTDAKMYYYYQNPSGIMLSGFNLKKLDGIQAFRNQLSFFADGGFNNLIPLSVSRLFCYENRMYINMRDKGYKTEAKNLKKDIKKDAEKYKKYLNKLPFKEKCDALFVAYPGYKLFLHLFALPGKIGIKKKISQYA